MFPIQSASDFWFIFLTWFKQFSKFQSKRNYFDRNLRIPKYPKKRHKNLLTIHQKAVINLIWNRDLQPDSKMYRSNIQHRSEALAIGRLFKIWVCQPKKLGSFFETKLKKNRLVNIIRREMRRFILLVIYAFSNFVCLEHHIHYSLTQAGETSEPIFLLECSIDVLI